MCRWNGLTCLEGAIPDVIANRIVEDIIVPNFRAGQFYEGFSSATDALIAAARGEFTASNRSTDTGIDPETLIMLIWIGLFKFTPTEAAAIKPLMENHFLLRWMYNVFPDQIVSNLIGIVEILIAVGILLSYKFKRISIVHRSVHSTFCS